MPWSVFEIPGGYRVDEANGKRLGYSYANAHVPDVLTPDEALRMAEEFAKLPELRRRGDGRRGRPTAIDEL